MGVSSDEQAFLQQLEDRETSMLVRCSDSMRRATIAAAAAAGVSREEWLRAAIRARLTAGEQ